MIPWGLLLYNTTQLYRMKEDELKLFFDRLAWAFLLIPESILFLLRGLALVFVLATGVKLDPLDVRDALKVVSSYPQPETGYGELEIEFQPRWLDEDFSDAEISDFRKAFENGSNLSQQEKPEYEFSNGVFYANGQPIGSGHVALAGTPEEVEELVEQASAEYAERAVQQITDVLALLELAELTALILDAHQTDLSLLRAEASDESLTEHATRAAEQLEAEANDFVRVGSPNGLLTVPVRVSIESTTGAGEQYVTRGLGNKYVGYGRNANDSKYHFYTQYKADLDAANAAPTPKHSGPPLNTVEINGLHVPVVTEVGFCSNQYRVTSVNDQYVSGNGETLPIAVERFKTAFAQTYEVVGV